MSKILKRFYLYLVLFFFYAPIFVLIIFSFNKSKSRTVWTGFTFDWYLKLFSDSTILDSVYITLLVSVLAALISTVLGTSAAIGIMSMKKKMRFFMMNVTYIPILSPEIIMGVALMLLFVWLSHSLNFFTLLLAHISFDTPYVIFSVMPKLRQLDPHLYEAALDLGASPGFGFRKVVLPQIMSGIITGMLLAFTLSVDDFVISYFTSGQNSQTLSITIYAMTRKRVSPEINALSTLLFIFVLLLLIIVNVRQSAAEAGAKKAQLREETESQDEI